MKAKDSHWLATHFLRCEPWLQAALDRDIGTHTIDDVWQMIAAGSAQFWPTPNAAMVTTIETYPRAKLLRGWLAGGDLEEVRRHEPKIRAFAEREGCTGIIIAGRRGWLKAFEGYSEIATTMYRGLADGRRE